MSRMVDQEDLKYLVADDQIGRRIMQLLTKHYPGHGWMIEVKSKHGVFNIWNAVISKRFGYVQKMSEIVEGTNMDLDKVVVRIAGELLERAKLNRGRLNEDELVGKSLLYTGELANVDKS